MKVDVGLDNTVVRFTSRDVAIVLVDINLLRVLLSDYTKIWEGSARFFFRGKARYKRLSRLEFLLSS